ncbi:MAG: DUF1330 domain-containing protein, partial [Betaproteobacteria bacterium]
MTAYIIADVTVTNPDGYAAYRPLAAASIAAHGGRFIARGGAVESLEGGWSPGRVVIIEFPSMAAARAWYNCQDYQDALKIRLENSTGRV